MEAAEAEAVVTVAEEEAEAVDEADRGTSNLETSIAGTNTGAAGAIGTIETIAAAQIAEDLTDTKTGPDMRDVTAQLEVTETVVVVVESKFMSQAQPRRHALKNHMQSKRA